MRITERKVSTPEEEGVVLKYIRMTKDFADIREYITGKEQLLTVYGREKEMLQIRRDSILYFEAVGELVFVYTKDEVYEIKKRLYQIEEELKKYKMLRASKSLIINIYQIKSVRSALNGRLYAKMANDEEVLVSRQYAKEIKSCILAG